MTIQTVSGFEFKRVHTSAELNEIFKLRYKVYVEEWGFEKAEDHIKGVELDDYDDSALHFMALRHGNLIGTIRMILSSQKGLPIQKNCTINQDLDCIDHSKIAEISRLAVSKDYRRRQEDAQMYGSDSQSVLPFPVAEEMSSKRRRQEVIIGLFKAMYAESKIIGLTHWCAVMAKALHILLTRLGIIFKPIGPEVDYHGRRIPYLLCIEEAERIMERINPMLYREFAEAARDERIASGR
ncbi:MAG: PEP-CTERM/exosortase system-associated acyltransferase [Dissulfurispiraceae bacterium]|jgi:N-acyl amino acid synthase of PEP-CTERM/exosortase system|nr:PEP-CTERM/exosortase system-associated acyltransferase [Dissulfurispiraceae bacterium]